MQALLFVAVLAAALVASPGLGFAAEPPASETTSLWDAIVDDPRAVATLIGAFAGFTLGVLIKFGVDLLLDRIRRRQARRALAAELHAELGWVMKATELTIDDIEATIEGLDDDDEQIETTRHQWQKWQLPPMPVLDAHIGQFGLLDPFLARLVVSVGGVIAWTRHYCASIGENAGEREIMVDIGDLRYILRLNKGVVHALVVVNKLLPEVAGVRPYDWGKIEAKLGPDPEDSAEA